MAEYSIGVDLGGTNLRVAAINGQGKILQKITGVTKLSAGRHAVVSDIVAAINALRASLGAEKLVGIGIGTPGFIVMETGVITQSPNLPGFENFPIRDEIERVLRAPVLLENDANAAALGEKWMGMGHGINDLMLLTLGTGIGGGIIIGGRILHGFYGMAGELGHVTVVPNGNPCACGNVGCLEKHASATAISCMAKLMGLGDLTSEEVYQVAAQGNAKALDIFTTMGQTLGLALAMMINTLNLPLYLLSGGMLPAWDFFAPAMLEECRKRSFVFRNTKTRIEKAALGNEAGLYGAAYLPFQSRIIAVDTSI